jgi:hypothetical protein
MESSTLVWHVQKPISTRSLGNSTPSLLKANISSLPLPRVVRLSTDSTTVTTFAITVQAYSTSTPTSSSYDTWTPTSTAQLSATPTPDSSRISSSAALGIGFAAGVIGIIILLTAALFIYRCWKIRRSPAVHKYEQARLWKGFTPATPSTARTTLIESKMADVYFTEVSNPSTPAFLLSPPVGGQGQRWSAATWTPRSPPVELSV